MQNIYVTFLDEVGEELQEERDEQQADVHTVHIGIGGNKKKTVYCYSEDERVNAINELSPNPEITRFKGLGEISPDEFKHFIGKDMRLEQVTLRKTDAVKELLEFYMGKNTMERQNFIIDNLVIEEDLAS